jgi:hypothetical protein
MPPVSRHPLPRRHRDVAAEVLICCARIGFNP